MAEGLLKARVGDDYEVFSAGTKPGGVREEAIAALAEIGIDISENRSKSVNKFEQKTIDFVLTVCDNARENCPYFPARTKLIHHAFEDPAIVEGDFDTRLAAFTKVRDEISAYLTHFLADISEGS